MVCFSRVLVASVVVVVVSAAPHTLQRRIAQVTTDATKDWEQACLKAGGAQECNPISQKGFGSLLAAGDKCAQQDAADEMIDLAKKHNNDAEMIRLAQIFVQQPRNAPDSLQVPYCQKAPRNTELDGLFHCQFAGSKFPQFSGDQSGNKPLGGKEVTPPGSCPAKPDGPVPDGVQLNSLVKVPKAAGGAAPAAPAAAAVNAPPAAAPPAPAASSPAAAPAAPAPAAPIPAANTLAVADFVLQNGKDALALNAKFKSNTASSPCTGGEVVCVGDQTAQCDNGKLVVQPCAGGTICAALPLVLKAGTSVTCTTAADRDARIAATGATAGAAAPAPAAPAAPAPAPAAPAPAAPAAPAPAAPAPAANAPAAAGFVLQNGKDALALNAKFKTNTASSPCTDGEVVCVGDQTAKCDKGKLVVQPCAGGTICAALPLVLKAGTSVTCTTAADRDARIAATGASGLAKREMKMWRRRASYSVW